MNGGDATEAFAEFHLRSKKAHLVLKSLPHRPAPKDVMAERGYNNREELTRDYAELRRQFEAEGLFKPCASEVAYRLAEIVAIHALGLWLLGQGPGAFWLGLTLLGIGQGRCGYGCGFKAGLRGGGGFPRFDRGLLLGFHFAGRSHSDSACVGRWLMHEGGHYSMTGNIFIDRSLQTVLYGVGCGMSASWWRSQHNRHHATPQKVRGGRSG